MKIPLSLACATCGTPSTVWISLEGSQVEFTGDCGHYTSASFGLSITIGDLVLRRAYYELTTVQDFSLTIVFSAMGLECELSRLHHKWENIKALLSPSAMADPDLDAMLRKFTTIRGKLEAVARLMHPGGLDDFVSSQATLRATIKDGFPSLRIGSLAEDFQKALFWPRNRILHLGDAHYREPEARRAFNIASVGVHVFKELDRVKRSTPSI